jgi:hypothetical protein
VTCGDGLVGQAGALARRALGLRSPSRDLVEAMRLADPAGTLAREVERVRGELPRSFTCPRCGMTSHNPADAVEGYCGNCHDWTRPVGVLADPDSPISRWVRGEPLFGPGGDRG